ncbi:DUF3486 family protein [Aromatoleum toluvorans]|uniref:DUF3486 family protein n=1 Tax=Aromatoleum toluvorans TaxID=92002 RepID=A0ABX1Q3V9_9RHOO|nr:phage protein Gp27 family protein [Aromatoleum toluvorans]NMG46411.1 DUF3486 family protein [Aromatoleum toluvorans]
MARKSSIESLPPAARKAVQRALYERGFRDYTGLVAELAEQGYAISRTALHRYGRKLEEAVKAAELDALVHGDEARPDTPAGRQLDFLNELEGGRA